MGKEDNGLFWENVRKNFDLEAYKLQFQDSLGCKIPKDPLGEYIHTKSHLIYATLILDRVNPSCESDWRYSQEERDRMYIREPPSSTQPWFGTGALVLRFPEPSFYGTNPHTGFDFGTVRFSVTRTIVEVYKAEGCSVSVERFTERFLREFVDSFMRKEVFSENLHPEEYKELRAALNRLWERTFTPESRQRILQEHEKKEKKKEKKNSPENRAKREELEKLKEKQRKAERLEYVNKEIGHTVASCPLDPEIVRILLGTEDEEKLKWIGIFISFLSERKLLGGAAFTQEEKQAMVDMAALAQITQM